MVTKNLPWFVYDDKPNFDHESWDLQEETLHVLFVSHKLSPSVFNISFMANILLNFVYDQFLPAR